MKISLIYVIITTSIACSAKIDGEDAFPGWMGDSYRGREVSHLKGGKGALRGSQKVIFDPSKVTQLSWKPRAFLYSGFLSDDECDHIMNLAIPELHRSSVVDSESGGSVVSKVRTSSGMFINKGHDEVIKRIEDRIAKFTFLPVENGEATQVLRYGPGQKYEGHYDYFFDRVHNQRGGHRYATVLMYLNNVEEGGETVFPNAKPSKSQDETFTECGRSGLGVKPKKGDALLFFSMQVDATPDRFSLHTACPVVRGEKWSAAKWIRVGSFDRVIRKSSDCINEHAMCYEWAASGECLKNARYMVGDVENFGSCRLACGVCGPKS